MKKVCAVVIIILSFNQYVFSQIENDSLQPPIKYVAPEEMVEWMDSLTTFWMDSVNIPGMVVSIVTGDSIIMEKGYGYINQEKTALVDASSSPFRIASISKTFTALADLQLVSEGKLDLNSDVSAYLHFNIERYKTSEITLHYLLTHSAGLDEKLLGGGTKDKSEVPKLGTYLSSSPPVQIREPGVTFSYSNMGYSLAGYLGELASGKPFHTYIDELILQPLEMTKTNFWRGEDPIYNNSKSYFLDDKGFREYPPYELKSYPSGSMISTADDMSRYMMMILNEGRFKDRQIVLPEVIDMLTKEVFTQDARLEGSRSYGFFNWHINGVKYMTHGGSIEGYRSMLYLYPELKVGMFIATNSSWGSRSNSEIGKAFRNDWLETTIAPIDTALSQGMPERANNIAGSYFTTRSPFTSIMRIGRLTNWTLDVKFNDEGYMYIAGNPDALYAETEPLTYIISSDKRDVASKIIFKENEEGDVAYMFTSGTNSYYRLKWWERTNVQLIYVLSIFGIFLFFLLYNIVGFFRRKHIDGFTRYQTPYKCSVYATLFHVITFLTIGFYLYLSDGLVFDFGLPWFLKALMLLPIVAVILTIFSVYKSRSVWYEWSISKFKKALFSINLVALVLIIPFLYYWNMLGFNF